MALLLKRLDPKRIERLVETRNSQDQMQSHQRKALGTIRTFGPFYALCT